MQQLSSKNTERYSIDQNDIITGKIYGSIWRLSVEIGLNRLEIGLIILVSSGLKRLPFLHILFVVKTIIIFVKNTPIIGRVAKGELIHSFREQKLALKARGYPIKETRDLVKQLFDLTSDRFESIIDKNTILVNVPSGSGTNKITMIFNKMLEGKFGCSTLPEGIITKGHLLEAKHNLSLEKRLTDPIRFNVDPELFQQFTFGKKVIITDDLIGSGESAIKLKKEIEAVTRKEVLGLVNLVTVENRYPTEQDLKRCLNKIGKLIPMSMKVSGEVMQQLKIVFSDYTRQKLNRFERQLRDKASVVGGLRVIDLAASLEPGYAVRTNKVRIVSEFVMVNSKSQSINL